VIEQALEISDIKERYEFVYDYLCDYLDAEFKKHNYCDFKDDKCIANRLGITNRIMTPDCPTCGCCYSYNYGPGLSIRNKKLCEHLKDNRCDTKCISCKLFTCRYLKAKGVQFDINTFPDINKIFNKKQIMVLQTNFFISKERIIEKLVKEATSKTPYWLYWLFELSVIK